MRHISNESLYEDFRIDPVDNIMVSRQLRWIGKIALMEENRLPRKFISTWHINPRSHGRPQTTIRHTYMHALRMIEAISPDDKQGQLETWLKPILYDPRAWEARRKTLTPNLIGWKE